MVMAPLKAKALIVLLLLLAAAPTLVVSAEKVPPSSALYHFNLIHADATDGGDTTTYSDRAKNQGGKYLMVVDMGPPGNKFTAVAGTGGDVTWTRRKEQCDHARRWECPSDRPQDCVFRKQYGRSNATGFMADETLFFPSSSSSRGGESEAAVSVSVDLACAQKCQGDKGDVDCNRLIPKAADGVISLDRGPKSPLKKLGITRLSYCLGSRASPLWLGGAKLSLAAAAAAVQTTPLVPRAVEGRPEVVWANKYYVELEEISVTTPAAASASASASAGKVVSIPKEAFSHRSLGGRKGVMFVDSGLTYSKLETAAYNVVKNLLAQQLKTKPLPGKNTCFKIDHANTAANNIFINLHLAKDPDAEKMSPGGDATATMTLGWSNYMKPGAEPGSSCLAIKDSGQGISALGNFQQHNIHMVYDLVDKKLFFVPVQDCSASNIKLID